MFWNKLKHRFIRISAPYTDTLINPSEIIVVRREDKTVKIDFQCKTITIDFISLEDAKGTIDLLYRQMH